MLTEPIGVQNWVASITSVSVAVTLVPITSVPSIVTVLEIVCASKSSCVTV